MKWVPGRQLGDYFKLKLLEWRFFDLYLLKFMPGSNVPPHKDPVKGKRHYRFNICLWGKDTFKCEKPLWRCGRLAWFRSDEQEHSLDTVKRTTYILSLGYVLKGGNTVMPTFPIPPPPPGSGSL